MATQDYNEAFLEALEAMEPRAPLVTLLMDRPSNTRPAHTITVTVRLQDNLTCAELGEYTIDPVSALHMLHRASRFALDHELCEVDHDFVVELYAVVNAWYHNAVLPPPITPVPTIHSATFGEIVKLIAEHMDSNGGACAVNLDGAYFSVQG